MITEWFLALVSGFADWVLSLLPSFTQAEGVIVTPANWVASFLAGGASLGGWLPWPTIAVAFPIVVGLYISIFLLKILRQLVAHLPQIGGSG